MENHYTASGSLKSTAGPIAIRLAEIEAGSGPAARNRVRSSLSAFFNFAVREGLIEVNPVAGTGKADELRSRDRVLSQPELTAVLSALGEDQFGDIVRLLVLTGQRRDEIGGLRWSEVDFDRGLIVLPPARTKNKRLHELPLSGRQGQSSNVSLDGIVILYLGPGQVALRVGVIARQPLSTD